MLLENQVLYQNSITDKIGSAFSLNLSKKVKFGLFIGTGIGINTYIEAFDYYGSHSAIIDSVITDWTVTYTPISVV